MIHRVFFLAIPVVLFSAFGARAQERTTTFGLQVKPVFPLSFFDPLTSFEKDDLKGSVELQGGFSFGGLVRTGLSKSISLEVGINQIQRRYDWAIGSDTSTVSGSGSIRWVGYEIPVVALVYVRLGERSWMNNAIGFSADMYPSDVVQAGESARTYWFRSDWVQAGIVANVGVEYRTLKSGIIYLGATYHRPFGDMVVAELTLRQAQVDRSVRAGVAGSYLTVDLRYFFHEDPDKRRRSRN